MPGAWPVDSDAESESGSEQEQEQANDQARQAPCNQIIEAKGATSSSNKLEASGEDNGETHGNPVQTPTNGSITLEYDFFDDLLATIRNTVQDPNGMEVREQEQQKLDDDMLGGGDLSRLFEEDGEGDNV